MSRRLELAFRSNAGASRQVLEAARARGFELLLSVPLMLEYESVLTRPEYLAACGASREDISAVLDELASFGKRVELVIRRRPMLPDSNDEMVLETAINGCADAIVTFNDRVFYACSRTFSLFAGAAGGNRLWVSRGSRVMTRVGVKQFCFADTAHPAG